MSLRFNGHWSKSFKCNKGIPQGLPLSPILFGVYVSDLFAPRFRYSRGMSQLVCSYVNDGIIMIAAPTKKHDTCYMDEMFEDCLAIGKSRGMRFEAGKCEWIGFRKGFWHE